jgi:hypothetical protein
MGLLSQRANAIPGRQTADGHNDTGLVPESKILVVIHRESTASNIKMRFVLFILS